jgi:hypothetical protein
LPWGFLWFVSRGLKVGLFCGLLLVGSVVRLLLLVYSVCIRGALRFFFLIKLQLLIKKKNFHLLSTPPWREEKKPIFLQSMTQITSFMQIALI